MEFILAKPQHIKDICLICEQAKAQLKAMGVDQWQKGYPSEAVWEQDIEEKTAIAAVDNGKVLGAFTLLMTPEASYDEIDGSWLTDLPYASMHRVCVSDEFKGKGIAGAMFRFGIDTAREKGFRSMRIDTHPQNDPMLRALEKAGFTRCGNITIKGGSEDGDPRVAFEMRL